LLRRGDAGPGGAGLDDLSQPPRPGSVERRASSLQVEDETGSGGPGDIRHPGWISQGHAVLFELVFVGDIDGAVLASNHVQIEIDHLYPVGRDPLGDGGPVHVDLDRMIVVEDRRPPPIRGDELDEGSCERDRLLVTPLHDRPSGCSQPDTVGVLTEANHLVAPMPCPRMFVVLDYGHPPAGSGGASGTRMARSYRCR